jgi:hypothetical protein
VGLEQAFAAAAEEYRPGEGGGPASTSGKKR